MTGSFFEPELNQILAEVKAKTNHPLLSNQLNYPAVATLKIHLLLLYLRSQSLPIDVIRSICTATTLVQMGLDIHDRISNEKERTDRQIRTRQLQVLAGDYFSSQYYAYLSEIGDIPLISRIADSIRYINKQKVTLHYLKLRSQQDKEMWLKLKTEIESALVCGLIDDQDTSWHKLVEHFITIDLLKYGALPKEWTSKEIANLIQRHVILLKQCIHSIQDGIVKEELLLLANLFDVLPGSLLVAEER